MAYQQSDLDAIKRIKASGMLSGELPSVGRVQYRSLAELERIENSITAELNAAAGTKAPRRVKIFAVKDL
jgi:hypothetical protein